MKTLKLTAIDDSMGAKLTTNGDMCDVPFLCGKSIARIHSGNVCKPCDVTRAWHCPLFFGAGGSRKSSRTA